MLIHSYHNAVVKMQEGKYICLRMLLLFSGQEDSSFTAKAHHGATFSALAHAAAAVPEKKWILLMYGTAIMPEIPTALEEAAKHLCPNVDVWLLDGHNIQLGDLARTASDMAISLVDCLQETFWLAPVEAMASGLPVVVSNWDGYRDTVVDGRTGYLIETHSFEPGWNNQINQQLAVNENALNEVVLL